ncbi:hypothetical protein GYMLUDRAFT_593767 [Collybiopsis luxurians FD-317 M1]|uniref:Uncharacterized protein n=1 Tax=Collybiopsis luxurians FD-317 M1 TaxID=944289 RepID=A0A0D0BZE4_9AGAR|nr:hypothetical protein GYMLUDRAFT_593767 [Collybiopsis luxurians FD-317 M1]
MNCCSSDEMFARCLLVVEDPYGVITDIGILGQPVISSSSGWVNHERCRPLRDTDIQLWEYGVIGVLGPIEHFLILQLMRIGAKSHLCEELRSVDGLRLNRVADADFLAFRDSGSEIKHLNLKDSCSLGTQSATPQIMSRDGRRTNGPNQKRTKAVEAA